MSLSAMRLHAQVWPTWLPRAIANVTEHHLTPALHFSIENSAVFPVVPSTTLQSTLQSSTEPQQLLPITGSPQRRRSHQQFRALSDSQSRTAAYFHHSSRVMKRAFTTSSLPVPPLAATWHAPPLPLSRPVTIIGSGVLGRRLAVLWASTGRPVTLYDNSPDALLSSQAFVADTLSEYCARQRTMPGKVHFTTSFHDACAPTSSPPPWMVIEAVPEDIELKISILGRVDRTVPRDCIIATNSASFRSRELVSEVQHRERVLNTLYYIPPANLCVELMSCGYTAPNLIPYLSTQMQEVRLRPMHVQTESTGMIFPRLFGVMKREVLKMLQERVAKPEEVDELFKDFFGSERGVCEMMDRVGLDTVAKTEAHLIQARRETEEGYGRDTDYLEWLITDFVDKGKLGEKSGEGLVFKKHARGKGDVAGSTKAGRKVWEDHSLDVSGL